MALLAPRVGGGGVDGAIHRAAGPELLDECRALGGCPTGEAKITRGYRLPARWVIHTVGPVWPAHRAYSVRQPTDSTKAGSHPGVGGQGGKHQEEALLAGCYRSCFSLAEKHGIATIAFPSISTGAYRFPIERAARIALAETRRFLKRNRTLRKVIFVCFDRTTYDHYRRLAEKAGKPVGSER